MLRIKENIDLKELEKFGFRKKFNQNDGSFTHYEKRVCKKIGMKLEETYIIYVTDTWRSKRTLDITICNYPEKVKRKDARKLKLKIIKSWVNDYDETYDEIYDLISSGLVEKVEG